MVLSVVYAFMSMEPQNDFGDRALLTTNNKGIFEAHAQTFTEQFRSLLQWLKSESTSHQPQPHARSLKWP